MKKHFLVRHQKCAKRKIKRSIENNLNTQTRQKVELKSAKTKASSKGENLAKISKRTYATKEKGVASDNIIKRVTKEHKFDGVIFFERKAPFWGKPGEAFSVVFFHRQN